MLIRNTAFDLAKMLINWSFELLNNKLPMSSIIKIEEGSLTRFTENKFIEKRVDDQTK